MKVRRFVVEDSACGRGGVLKARSVEELYA